MFWWFSANVLLPFGVGLLLFMTMPLHTKYLRAPTQHLVDKLLDINFFGMKAFGEPLTVFHAIELIYGTLFLILLNPFQSKQQLVNEEEFVQEDLLHRMARWHRERNMYIAAFIFIVYLMIFQYHNLRKKYDKLKAEKAQAAKKVQ